MSRSLAHAIVAAAFVGLLALACLQVPGDWNWSGVWAYRQKFVQGWLVTLGLSVAALVLSVLIGLVVALLLAARNPLVEATGRIYVELIRGTPLLVQLLLGFYVVANAVGLENRFVVGTLVLAAFSGAYMAEIFRGGLDAIPKTQRDSARAIGLPRWQAFRLIAVPAAAPGILAAGLLGFILSWNEFLFALVLSGPDSQTLPVGLAALETHAGVEIAPLAAATVLSLLPVFALLPYLRRHLIKGLSLGALK